MTDGEEKGKGFWDSAKPTWRDGLYAMLGFAGGVKLPNYIKSFVSGQQRELARITADELRKNGQQNEPYASAGAGASDVGGAIVAELQKSREVYKSLEEVVSKLNEKLGKTAGG